MQRIKIACEAYRFDFGVNPPDKVIVDGKHLKSSAALAFFLVSPDGNGPYLDPSDRSCSDVDGDGHPELLDTWRRPIEYDNLWDDPGGFDFYGPNDPRTDMRARNVRSYDLFTQPNKRDGKPITNWDSR